MEKLIPPMAPTWGTQREKQLFAKREKKLFLAAWGTDSSYNFSFLVFSCLCLSWLEMKQNLGFWTSVKAPILFDDLDNVTNNFCCYKHNQ